MAASLTQLREWMDGKEGEHLEFKEAKNRYDFEELVKYCAALANEGGGKVILGVSDRRPRRVVGTSEFAQPERTRRGLRDRLPLGIDFDEVHHPDGRVLVFHVPPRPVGTPVQYKGVYWMRDADSLTTMSEDRLRQIFAESGHDFSADPSPAPPEDLDRRAVEDFRRRWIDKARRAGNADFAGRLETLSPDQLLGDAETLVDGRVTYAALVLFGTRQAVGRHLAQAEVVFEYRSGEASGPAQDRREYRQGFFSFYDELWSVINLRNDKQHYQDGLFVLDVPTFGERPVREAILNAVSHRDYQLGGSAFVRQYPRRLEIDSPGGLPVGITLDNILDRQNPRNRRIADIFTKCGLVERSGQGMNLIFEDAIRQSKPVPDFARTDRYQVGITLYGTVQDPNFVRFLEKIGQEKTATFTTRDWLILEMVHREQKIPDGFKDRLPRLLDLGVVERNGRNKFLLSRRYYAFIGKKATYTRKRGLDREQNLALLLKHIEDNAATGTPFAELQQVLPALGEDDVKTLLRTLKRRGKAHAVGKTRASRWFPGPPPP